MSAQRAGMVLVASVLALGVAAVERESAQPAPSLQRTCGVALGLFASDPAYDYGPMLAEIADHHATDVLLSVPWTQAKVTSSTLAATDGPSDATLRRTLRQAGDLGLAVSLMPIVRLDDVGEGRWRGALQPEDRDAWFAAYGALLAEHADLAAAFHVARLVVGSELSSLEGDAERWRPLLAETRRRFPGTLTWSANWDRFEQVPFWDDLDEVGVSAWFELGDAPAAGWDDPQRRLRAIAQQTGKPVLLTEVGYPARATAAARPWDHAGPATPDPALQAELLSLFFTRFADESAVQGAFVWNWFGHGGHADAGYSPRGRPAAGVLKRHYRRWCSAS